MINYTNLQLLIKEYSDLKILRNNMTPNERGQRFNYFISEMLQCYRINSQASERSKGEIDVSFMLEGRRFILEAKWQKKPNDTGDIAKLQKRVRQRLGGTVGILVSMSGFSADALKDVNEGEQLSVLLLDKNHFDCMLSGFIPPLELISLLLNQASFYGKAYCPSIIDLYPQSSAKEIKNYVGLPREISENDLIVESKNGFKAKAILSNLPFGQSGIAVLGPNKIIITLNSGLFSYNLGTKKVKLLFSIPDCSRNVIVHNDDIYVIRKNGVACFNEKFFKIVAGGLPGATSLFKAESNELWAFSNGEPNGFSPQITKIEHDLGNEIRYNIDIDVCINTNAIKIGADSFFIIGNNSVLADLKTKRIIPFPLKLSNPMGLGAISNIKAIVVSDPVQLSEIDIADKSIETIAKFNLQGSVSELTMSDEKSGYFFSHYTNQNMEPKGIVVFWEKR
jgi:hypothetical protein